MKRLLIALLFIIALASTKAQDRIITIQNDTIECRIISIGDERIIFEQETSENYAVGKSIATSNVSQYFRLNVPGVNMGSYGRPAWLQRSERPYLFTLQGGMARLSTDFSAYKSWMTAIGVPASEADDYIGKLKNGFHINAAFHYLLFSNIGVGVDYSLFYSASDKDFLISGYNPMNLPMYVKQSLNEKVFIHFAGPSLLLQQFPGNSGKIKILESLSSGIVMFRNEIRSNDYTSYGSENAGFNTVSLLYYENANSLTTGSTFGIKGGVSVEYCILPQLSAGLTGNFIWAKLKKASFKNANNEINDQELEKAMKVSHLDYGLTLRCNF
jgi:hypothetical protein